jgi:hypothetical protein
VVDFCEYGDEPSDSDATELRVVCGLTWNLT